MSSRVVNNQILQYCEAKETAGFSMLGNQTAILETIRFFLLSIMRQFLELLAVVVVTLQLACRFEYHLDSSSS